MYRPSPTETNALIFAGICLLLTIVGVFEERKAKRLEKEKREMMQAIERRLKGHE